MNSEELFELLKGNLNKEIPKISEELFELLKGSLNKEIPKIIEKGLSKNSDSELFPFLIKEGKKLSLELERYRLDYAKYKTGVFLWWNEEYPTFMKLLNLLLKKPTIFQFPCYENMKLVVKDYYTLINNSKNLNSKLFTKELQESVELVFKRNINPINILQKKNPLIKLVNDEVNAYINKTTPILKDYIKQISPEFKKYFNSIISPLKELISFHINNIIKCISGEINLQDLMVKINKVNDQFSELLNKTSNRFESLMNKIQKDTKVRKEDMLIYSEVLETSNKLIEKKVFQDFGVNIRNFIILLKDIDSFNIHFCKFIYRLYHILTRNDRKYKDKVNCFFNIKPRHYDNKTRGKLKNFIIGQFKSDYPNLATFLLKGFEFNKIRKLEAHEIPKEIRLSDDKKFAYISQTGDVPDIQMDLEYVSKFINSYCFFIDALGLY